MGQNKIQKKVRKISIYAVSGNGNTYSSDKVNISKKLRKMSRGRKQNRKYTLEES